MDINTDNNKDTFYSRGLKIKSLEQELKLAEKLHKVAVRERDYERTLCDEYHKEVMDLRNRVEFLEDLMISGHIDKWILEEYEDTFEEIK
jgi:hypothetical protein